MIDRKLLGIKHLYRKPVFRNLKVMQLGDFTNITDDSHFLNCCLYTNRNVELPEIMEHILLIHHGAKLHLTLRAS